MRRRLAYRIQELFCGDLSEEFKRQETTTGINSLSMERGDLSGTEPRLLLLTGL